MYRINYFLILDKKFKEAPLYQVIRNVEENFADAYAALLHKEKHKAFDIYHYVSSRNSTNSGKSKHFDFNINSLGDSINKINDINLTSKSIDEVCEKLYSILIKSSLEVLVKTISSDIAFKDNLINNLKLLNQKDVNIFDSIEILLCRPSDNTLVFLNDNIIDKINSIRNSSLNNNSNSSNIKP